MVLINLIMKQNNSYQISIFLNVLLPFSGVFSLNIENQVLSVALGPKPQRGRFASELHIEDLEEFKCQELSRNMLSFLNKIHVR